MNCIFCGDTPKEHNGPHHIIPKVIKKALGITGARGQKFPSRYKLPICGQCHVTLTSLQKPLIMIILHFTGKGPLPDNLDTTVEGIYQKLNQGSEMED